MSFCSVVNCMDGRVQEPVLKFVSRRFGTPYPDVITEPGPNGILARDDDEILSASIINRLKISIEKHDSKHIAVVCHHDCLGNPGPKDMQIEHTRLAVSRLKKLFLNAEIIGLWVDENRQVHELP